MPVTLASTVAACLMGAAVLATAARANEEAHASGTAEAASPDTVMEGTWTLVPSDDDARRLQLILRLGPVSWGSLLLPAELRGFPEAALAAAAPTPVAFRIEREAGVLAMEGEAGRGRAAGRYRFHPDRQFAAALRSLGVVGADRLADRDLLPLAVAGASAADVRAFAGLGLGPLHVEEVIELSVHDVTPAYVRSLRSLGLPGTGTVHDVVELRIHRVTPEFVRGLEAVGFRDLSRRDLLALARHGVTGEVVRELRALGYPDLDPRQAAELAIHGVTPGFIREMHALGYRGLSPHQFAQLRLHRVTPAFIRELRESGYRDLSPEALVRMKLERDRPARTRTRGRR